MHKCIHAYSYKSYLMYKFAHSLNIHLYNGQCLFGWIFYSVPLNAWFYLFYRFQCPSKCTILPPDSDLFCSNWCRILHFVSSFYFQNLLFTSLFISRAGNVLFSALFYFFLPSAWIYLFYHCQCLIKCTILLPDSAFLFCHIQYKI